MNNTKIEWCTRTLNPVVGCTYGCPYCYARKMNNRFGYVEDFSKPQFFPERLKMLKSKKPQIIFMDSMSDIADWKPEWIEQTFKAMDDNPQHIYLFLTKRFMYFYERLKDSENKMASAAAKYMALYTRYRIGCSITKQSDFISKGSRYANFLSIEPILEPITIESLIPYEYEWVIIGAETGNQKNKVVPKKEWIDNIVAQCKEKNIPVFMKQSLLPIMGEENMLRQFPESFNRS